MSRQILYLRGRSEEIAELVSALERLGNSVIVLRTFDELTVRAERARPQAVVIDASADEAEVAERLVELLGAQSLSTLPIVFIGKRAKERTTVAAHRFKYFMPVDYPFRIEVLLDSLVPTATLSAREEAEIALEPPKRALGGTFLLSGKAETFDERMLLPDHPRRAAMHAALEELDQRGPAAAAHSRRTAMVSSSVISALGSEPTTDAAVRTAALFLNWAVDQDFELDWRTLSDSSAEALAHVARGVRASAELVSTRFEYPAGARVLRAVAEVIERGGRPTSPENRAAETVLLSELVDRACWNLGRWDRMGAHRAALYLRTTDLCSDKEVAQQLGKVLAEASQLDTNPRKHLQRPTTLSERTERTLEREAAFREARERFGNERTLLLRLAELEPGMQLAQPLLTIDGKVMLRAGTVLTFDTFMRIIQLAAVRPVQEPVSVLR